MDRYQLSKILLNTDKKKRYKEALLLPTIPKTANDTYVVATIEDRLDLLAFSYYKNVTLWWVIAAANPDIRFDSFQIEPGTQIRIPSNNVVDEINSLILSVNKNR